MHLLINALAASAGGGLTYIRNVLPQLAARNDVQVTVVMNSTLREEFRAFSNIEFVVLDVPLFRRFWYEQSALPGIVRRCGADVLLATGNFALRKSQVPQILLSRNSIYTSADFYRDLRSRREYRGWLDTRLRSVFAKRSVQWADATVAPSAAFANELTRWTGQPVFAIHHGFDHHAFTADQSPLPTDAERKLRDADGCFKLLFVSHYNYYRNFETLIRALPEIRSRLSDRSIKLLLTCRLAPGANPGLYRPEAAAALVSELGVGDMIVELGAIRYSQLHQIYAQSDLYVTPAYTETFAHPLVEAMASGVPVIASDITVHREICADAAAYFPRFSPVELAETLAQVSVSSGTMRRMAEAGLVRSREFSWQSHVEKILALCESVIARGKSSKRMQAGELGTSAA